MRSVRLTITSPPTVRPPAAGRPPGHLPGPKSYCSLDIPTDQLAGWPRTGVDGELLGYPRSCADGGNDVVRIGSDGYVPQLEVGFPG